MTHKGEIQVLWVRDWSVLNWCVLSILQAVYMYLTCELQENRGSSLFGRELEYILRCASTYTTEADFQRQTLQPLLLRLLAAFRPTPDLA